MEIRSDGIAKNDLVGRRHFAASICENVVGYLAKNSDSLVIGINGAWGSGKSTLINFVKEEFISKSLPNHFLFEFNPWMFSGKEQLHSAFLNEYLTTIQSKKHKLRSSIKKISEILAPIGEVSAIAKAAKKVSENYYSVSILDRKIEINKILIDEGIKTLILIDDIDRLAPEEMIEIFQLVRLNVNFANTVFVLCFDKTAVKSAISSRFKLNGESYLGKIIQVDYSIPHVLPEDIEEIFFSGLNDLFKRYQIEFDVNVLNRVWLARGLRNNFKTIRDINRYLNAVEFRLPSIHRNIDIHDFLILEAVRLFDFEAYETIALNYKEAVMFGDSSTAKSKIQKTYSRLNGRILEYLLTPNPDKNDSEKRYRLTNLNYFDRYFALSTSKRDITEEEFQHFLKFRETRTPYVSHLLKQKRLSFLLRRLTISDVSTAIQDKLEISELLISVWKDYHFEFVDHHSIIWDALMALISSADDFNSIARGLIDQFCSSDSYFNPCRTAFKKYTLDLVDDDSDKLLNSFRVIASSQKQKIISSFKNDLQNYYGMFFWNKGAAKYYDHLFFIGLAKYHPDIYRSAIAQFETNEVILQKLIGIFVLNDSKSNKPFRIAIENRELLLPDDLLNRFETTLRKLDKDALPQDELITTTFFVDNITEFIRH